MGLAYLLGETQEIVVESQGSTKTENYCYMVCFGQTMETFNGSGSKTSAKRDAIETMLCEIL